MSFKYPTGTQEYSQDESQDSSRLFLTKSLASSFDFYLNIQQNQEQIALILHQVDVIHDKCHLSKRLQTDFEMKA